MIFTKITDIIRNGMVSYDGERDEEKVSDMRLDCGCVNVVWLWIPYIMSHHNEVSEHSNGAHHNFIVRWLFIAKIFVGEVLRSWKYQAEWNKKKINILYLCLHIYVCVYIFFSWLSCLTTVVLFICYLCFPFTSLHVNHRRSNYAFFVFLVFFFKW